MESRESDIDAKLTRKIEIVLRNGCLPPEPWFWRNCVAGNAHSAREVRTVDFWALPPAFRARVASASSASLTRLKNAPIPGWFATAYRDVVAKDADAADGTDDGGSVFDPRAYPNRPGSRSALAGERYFNAQHA